MKDFEIDDSIFAAKMLNKLELSSLEDWLYELSNYCSNEKNKYFYTGDKLFFPNLDNLLTIISNSIWSQKKPIEKKSEYTLIIGTTFATTGGHSRVARDIFNIEPNSLIIATDIFDQLKPDGKLQELKNFFKSENVFSSPHKGLAATCKWLIDSVYNINPNKIYILNHPQDPIPIIAANTEFHPRTTFVHHLDFAPSLGTSIDKFRHLDITNCTHCICNKKVSHSFLVPLIGPTNELQHSVNNDSFLKESFSIGGELKYTRSNTYGYEDLISDILSNGIFKHYHFGNLSLEIINAIHRKMTTNGINTDRFIYYGNVDELDELISKINDPIYIPSFPVNGGLSTLHAMSYGIPVLPFVENLNSNSLLSLAPLENYPNPSLYWNDHNSLIQALSYCINNYKKLSKETAEKYLSNHTPAHFAKLILDNQSNQTIDIKYDTIR